MADFFIDNMVKQCIIDIINHKDTLPNDTAVWKSLTKLMFKNYPAYQVYNWIEECLAEASDKQWLENKYPKNFWNEDKFIYPKKKSVIKVNLKKAANKKYINENLKIIDVAEKYSIVVKGNKALCPFHDDRNPSLRFYPITNSFNCFGCKAGGDVIEFIRRLEKLSREELAMYDLEQECYWKKIYWKQKKNGNK